MVSSDAFEHFSSCFKIWIIKKKLFFFKFKKKNIYFNIDLLIGCSNKFCLRWYFWIAKSLRLNLCILYIVYYTILTMYNVHSIKKKNFFGTKFFMQSGQLNTNRELEHFSNNKNIFPTCAGARPSLVKSIWIQISIYSI